jgi:hypothetical protein
MAADTDNVTLGSGTLYLNNVDVGHLKGDVELTMRREYLDFKPSNMIGTVKKFVITEEIMLKASSAELDLDNVKLAYGVTTSIATSQGSLSYDPSSFSFDASYDTLTIGGSKTINEVPLRFEHTRPSGVKVVVIFYNAASSADLLIPFKESDITLYDISFTGLADEDRSEGDMVGVILENPNKS